MFRAGFLKQSILILFFILLFFSADSVQAQGVLHCYSGSTAPGCETDTNPNVNNLCDPGYVLPQQCYYPNGNPLPDCCSTSPEQEQGCPDIPCVRGCTTPNTCSDYFSCPASDRLPDFCPGGSDVVCCLPQTGPTPPSPELCTAADPNPADLNPARCIANPPGCNNVNEIQLSASCGSTSWECCLVFQTAVEACPSDGGCYPRTGCPVNYTEFTAIDNCDVAGQMCCIPQFIPPRGECNGFFTDFPGECFFGRCPQGRSWEGINPIFPVCSNVGDVCCTIPPTPIPRPPLNPVCSNWSGIYSAIGCISVTSPSNFASFIVRWSIGVGGGVAFVFIVIGAFLIITSKGDPEKVKSGKEILTSAIGGLLLIIFSIFLLEVIGVRIFRLPGF